MMLEMAMAKRSGFDRVRSIVRFFPVLLRNVVRNLWLSKQITPFSTVDFGAFSISPLERSDMRSIDAIFASLNAGRPLGVQRTALLWLLGSRLCLVARDAHRGAVVGFAFFYFNERDQKEHTVHEGYIGLAEQVRGQGVATCMLRHALDNFSRSGFSGVSSRVSINNLPALKTNQNLGFVAVDTYFDVAMQEDRQYLVCDLNRYTHMTHAHTSSAGEANAANK